MKPVFSPPPERPSKWLEGLAVLVLLVSVCVLAWPGMKAPLLLDDLTHLEHVNTFPSWKSCFGPDAYGLFRPVKNLIYYNLKGLPLFQWHLLILTAHLTTMPAVYLLFRRLLGSSSWAFCVVLIWASCPTQVCTTVWMAAINLNLAVTLTCVCLYFHDFSRQSLAQPVSRAAGFTALAAFFLFLAECSYETAISAPALCILIDAFRRRSLVSREAIFRYAVFVVITLLYLAIRHYQGASYTNSILNSGFAPDTKGWQLTVSAPWFLWRHFSMWLAPAGRMEFLSSYIWGVTVPPWEVAVSWAWLLSVIGAIILSWKRLPYLAFGLLWFLITSFPTSNFIPIRSGPIEVYYLILPGVGLAVALTGCVKLLVEWTVKTRSNSESLKALVGGALLCLACLWRAYFIPQFWKQADLWCRPVELLQQVDLTRPGQYQVQAMIARLMCLQGELEQAKDYARKSHDTAPWGNHSALTLALIALQGREFQEAESRFIEVLNRTAEAPEYQDYARFHLAITLNLQETKRHMVEETLLPLVTNSLSPFYLKACLMQSEWYLMRNDPHKARRVAQEALHFHPESADLKNLLRESEKILSSPYSP